MPDERLLLAIVIRVVLVSAATLNVTLALGQYREYRDARGLRGFVSALSMLFGAVALAGGSSVIAAVADLADDGLRWLTTIGIAGFILGILFSVSTWWLDRVERKRRRGLRRDQATYRGHGDH